MMSAISSVGSVRGKSANYTTGARSVPGCVLWFDAQDPDNTGVTPTNGTTISTWYDKSGYRNNATANTPITFNTTGLNGLPALTFTNTQWLTGAARNTNNTMTIFAVCTVNTASSNAYARIIGLGAAGVNDYDNGSYMTFMRNGGGNGVSGDRSNLIANNNPTTGSVPYLFETLYDGSTATNTNYVQQGGATSTTSTVGTSSSNFNISAFAIGASANTGDGGGHLTGFIAEIVVYKTALTTAQRQYIEGQLSWKWGLQANLPSTHPYNTTTDFVFKIKGSAAVPTATTAGSGYSTTYPITNTATVAIAATVGTRANVFSFSGGNYLQISYNLPVVFTRTFWVSTATPGTNSGNVFSTAKSPVYFNGSTFLKNEVNWGSSTWASCVSTTPQTSTWIFYAVVQTASTVAMYVNGLLAASSSAGSAWVGDTSVIQFGAFQSGSFYTGYLDDMRLYVRALSATEISSIYAAG